MTQPTTIPEFGIPRENEERRDGGCGVVFDPQSQRYAVGLRERDGLLILFSGGVDPHENVREGVLREVTEESGLYDFLHVEKIAEAMTHYHHAAKNLNRVAHATCFLVVLKSASLVPTNLEAHEDFTLAWATPEEIQENWSARNETKGLDHWIYFLNLAVGRVHELGYK